MELRNRRFLVWGAGGHGRVVGDVLLTLGHEVVGYIDQDVTRKGLAVAPLDALVKYTEDEWKDWLDKNLAYPEGVDACALGIGNNTLRLSALRRLGKLAVPTLIHPSAMVSPRAQLDYGILVKAGATIEVGAIIGEGSIVSSAAVVAHDCVLGAGVHVSANATVAGGAQVGDQTLVAAGATVIPGVSVGRGVIIGAGSTVINDVPDGVTVVGSPARVIAQRSS